MKKSSQVINALITWRKKSLLQDGILIHMEDKIKHPV